MRKSTLIPSLGLTILASFVLPQFDSIAWGKPRINASRASREPGWSGPVKLTGEARDENQDTPILERPNRPLHVVGNMTRRHHYRGTVIPSHRDRVEMLQALTTGAPVPNEYVKDRYR